MSCPPTALARPATCSTSTTMPAIGKPAPDGGYVVVQQDQGGEHAMPHVFNALDPGQNVRLDLAGTTGFSEYALRYRALAVESCAPTDRISGTAGWKGMAFAGRAPCNPRPLLRGGAAW